MIDSNAKLRSIQMPFAVTGTGENDAIRLIRLASGWQRNTPGMEPEPGLCRRAHAAEMLTQNGVPMSRYRAGRLMNT